MANVVEFNSHKLDSNDGTDSEEFENTDPAIVAADVAAQTVCLRGSGMLMHWKCVFHQSFVVFSWVRRGLGALYDDLVLLQSYNRGSPDNTSRHTAP